MDRDQILAFDQHKEEMLDRELELFMETAIGANLEEIIGYELR